MKTKEIHLDFLALSKEIKEFVEKYAKIHPNWKPGDEEDEKYTGPDPYELLTLCMYLEKGDSSYVPRSDWSSCCYGPLFETHAQEIHNSIFVKLKNLAKQDKMKTEIHEATNKFTGGQQLHTESFVDELIKIFNKHK